MQQELLVGSQQRYLDPTKLDYREQWTPNGPIPLKVRQFGYYPNIGDWRPGDLLLVRNIEPNWTHKIIERVQRSGYAEEDARWHHAAVVLNDEGEICEADTPSGVKRRTVDRYVTGQHLIRIRRPIGLESDERWKIAMRSLVNVNERYAMRYLMKLYLLSRDGFSSLTRNYSDLPQREKICSQLYMDAYSTVTKKVLRNTRSGEITPAFLSLTDELEDVEVFWNKI